MKEGSTVGTTGRTDMSKRNVEKKCRHCKVEISENHMEMTCPKKNACYCCGKSGHRRQECGRMGEDSRNGIRRNTLPEDERNDQRAEPAQEQAQGEEMTLKEQMKKLAGVRRKQPFLVIRFESRNNGIKIPTK